MDVPPLFGSGFIGHSLVFRSTDDPPGGWVYEMDDGVVAELAWSRTERAVRMETEVGLCRVRFTGVLYLLGALQVGGDKVLEASYQGGLTRGQASVGPGRTFDFFSQVDRREGPWLGVDDADGVGVLRILPRLDLGVGASEVMVTPVELYAPFVGPLLALFGGLQVLRRVRPWLGISTALTRVM